MIWADYGKAVTLQGIPLITRDAVDFKANPTLASGDVKVSKDGGAEANITTLPDAEPDTSSYVRVQLSATEMSAAQVVITFVDQTGSKEWEDQRLIVYTKNHHSAYDPNGVIRKATAASGASGTITLDGGASSTDSAYRGGFIYIDSGTGAGQWNYITAYVGSTKVATVIDNWLTNPDSTSVFVIYAAPPQLRYLTATPPTAAAISTQIQSDIATQLGRIDAAISTRATPANVATEISNVGLTSTITGRIDTTVSSRLASSGYTTPPTAATVASAVRTELTTELGRIDAAITTRSSSTALATAQTAIDAIKVVSDKLADTLEDSGGGAYIFTIAALAQAPGGAGTTPEDIASAVRTELTTELGRIDAAISTRLATSGYTAPIAAATIASAVRTELTTELGRISINVNTLATATNLATAQTAIDAIPTTAEMSDLLDALDFNSSDLTAVKATTDKIDGMLILDDTDYVFSVVALENAPTSSLDTAAEDIAAAVRTELATELGRIDAAITTRASASNLSSLNTLVLDIPTNAELATALDGISIDAAAIASAVRTELTTELGRIDAAISTRATPAQVGTQISNYDAPTHAEMDTRFDAIEALAVPASSVTTPIGAIKGVTDKLATMLAADGGNWKYTAAALQDTP